VGKLVTATRPGGTAELEDWIRQQGWAKTIAESQSILIALQHGGQGEVAKEERADTAAHRTTTTNIKIALLLPIFTV
jgi:hypothetical protein